jgi:tRNA dimethylallyltransferase
MSLPKIICIVGPTASGKTALALALAREFNGEVVNADSRQVYCGMDIATGKEIAPDVPHHVFDVVDPDEEYSLAVWKSDAETAIAEIVSRGALPIVVGGTGLYVQALIENLDMPDVPPNPLLRSRLETMSVEEMAAELERCDPDTAKVIDRKNPRRLVRALEVVMATGESFVALGKKGEQRYDSLVIGLHPTPEVLANRIAERVEGMVDAGLLDEARELFRDYDASLPSMSGIGYPEVRLCLDGAITLEEMKERIVQNSIAYTKRQTRFFKKLPVVWMASTDEAREAVRKFL